MALFKRFRGREPQLDAMLRHYGIKDNPTRERVYCVKQAPSGALSVWRSAGS